VPQKGEVDDGGTEKPSWKTRVISAKAAARSSPVRGLAASIRASRFSLQ